MNNLIVRTLSGLLYVAAIVASLTMLPQAVLPLCILAMSMMLHEFWKVSIGEKILTASRIVALLTAIFTVSLIYGILSNIILANNISYLLLSLFSLLIVIPTIQVFSKDRFRIEGLGFIYYGLVWIVVPAITFMFLLFSANKFDGTYALSVFILVWSADVGAYLLGSALGQRKNSKKLAPSISPHKSWWGVFGGVLLAIAAAFILSTTGLLKIPTVHAIVLGILASASGISGDLFESLWKRHFNIKDSGKSIPGHGGFLDRLDSSLLAFPIAYIYLTTFNLI